MRTAVAAVTASRSQPDAPEEDAPGFLPVPGTSGTACPGGSGAAGPGAAPSGISAGLFLLRGSGAPFPATFFPDPCPSSKHQTQKQHRQKHHIPLMDEAGQEIQAVGPEISAGPLFIDVHIHAVQKPHSRPQAQALHQAVKLADLIIAHPGKQISRRQGQAYELPPAADLHKDPVQGPGDDTV